MAHTNNEWLDFRFGPEPPSNSSAKVYASDFHLVRVTSGSRYNQNILPSMTDKTADVSGGDGTYYFNTKYKQRQFSVNLAFDKVTDEDLSGIRKWLDGKEIQPLCFDEKPNIEYYAKVTGTPQLKYLPFTESEKKSNNITTKNSTVLEGALKSTLTTQNRADWNSYAGTYSIPCTVDREGTTHNYTTIIIHNTAEAFREDYPYELGFQDDTLTSTWFSWSDNGEISQVTSFIFTDFMPSDYSLLSLFATLPAIYTNVYKGEGSVTFTCYDPYGYSKTQYSKNLKNGALTSTISGEVDTPFRLEVSGRSSSDIITLYDNSLGAVASITLLSAVASGTDVVWDSKTGMVSDGTGPLNFSGNSMVNLSVGSKYTVKVNGNTTSSNAIIYYKHRFY